MTDMILYNDEFRNYAEYNVPKADLILTDIPYCLSEKAYGGRIEAIHDRKKQTQKFFETDNKFYVDGFLDVCFKLLKDEPTENGSNISPCIILFCSFEQQFEIINTRRYYNFFNYTPLYFVKNYVASPLLFNQKLGKAIENGMLLYRDRLPKFNNEGRQLKDWFEYKLDKSVPRVHPTQKPLYLLEQLISIFTDEGDVVLDLCAGSGTTLLAAKNLKRHAYGFEIEKEYVDAFYEKILPCANVKLL